jgi:hypothetical protein
MTEPHLEHETTFIKIGIADCPCARIKQIQTSNPLALVFDRIYNYPSRDMALSIEKRMHDIFKSHQTIGEWFVYSEIVGEKLDSLEAFLGEDLLYIQNQAYSDYIGERNYLKWDEYNKELENAKK